MKNRLLEKLNVLLGILERRKNNLVAKLADIDNLPNRKITKNTYKQWHEVYSKIKYLEVRIDKIQEQRDVLTKKRDIVRDFIVGSNGLFQKMCVRGINL